MWAANDSAPGRDALNVEAVNQDYRNWTAFLDLWDDTTASFNEIDDTSTWKMSLFEFATLPRPAAKNETVVDASVAGGLFKNQTNFPKGGATRTDGANGLDMTLTGYTVGTQPPVVIWTAFDQIQMQNALGGQHQMARVIGKLSCPTAADRTNFKAFRIQCNSPWNTHAAALLITNDAGLQDNSGGAILGYPAATPGAPTPFELYVPFFCRDNADFTAMNAIASPFDVFGGTNPFTTPDHLTITLYGNGPNQASQYGLAYATTSMVTWEEVAYDVLIDPLN
jgi:hypothetical protein